MDLWLIFITGLTIGGLTCMAVQGGLLASVIASREEDDLDQHQAKRHTLWPVAAFLVTKLIAYVILGFGLGAFGSIFTLSDTAILTVQILAGLYMLAVALNLLDVHPIFRYAVIQPPKFLFRMVRNQSKSKDFFAPVFLGAMTIFVPCGTTLAMEALAISSGSAIKGALIMGTFILGTTPLFFGLGSLTTLLGDKYKKRFLKFAAFVLIFLGINSVNSSLIVLGSPITLNKIAEASPIQINFSNEQEIDIPVAVDENGFQNAAITVTNNGYVPRYLKVKQGVPVKLTLNSVEAYSCALAFRIPAYRIAQNLKANDTKVVEFTPREKGKIAFSCSMGMYGGVIEVI